MYVDDEDVANIENNHLQAFEILGDPLKKNPLKKLKKKSLIKNVEAVGISWKDYLGTLKVKKGRHA